MSYRKVREVIEHSLTEGSERLMLMIIAEHCDDEGYGFPSVELLAKEANLTERYGAKLIARLLKRGELSLVRKGCSRRSNSYRLRIPPNEERRKWFEERRASRHSPMANPEQEDRVQTLNSRTGLTLNDRAGTLNDKAGTLNQRAVNPEREDRLTIREPSQNHHPNPARTGSARREVRNTGAVRERGARSNHSAPRDTVWSLTKRIEAAKGRIDAIRADPANQGFTVAGASILNDEAREEITQLKASIRRWECEILQSSAAVEADTGSAYQEPPYEQPHKPPYGQTYEPYRPGHQHHHHHHHPHEEAAQP